MYWSLILIKVKAFRPATLLERDSNTDVSQGIVSLIYFRKKRKAVDIQQVGLILEEIFFHINTLFVQSRL